MNIRIYDTQSRRLKSVESDGSKVSVYCCGPTVYRDAHVGNHRTFLLSDLIRRTLELAGYEVTIVQNITDVGHMSEDFLDEDKILIQAKLESSDPFAIARRYEERFQDDLSALNILPVTQSPRASDNIEIMQDWIARLLVNGNAYIGSDASVYFDATSFPTYGELSGNKLDALKPGHRYEYSDDGAKKFHADWALWKSAGHRTEMIWNSPWGSGFPGWHIECSAMSMFYLHQHVHVHVGGIDLRFPHHENERAQSNALLNRECVDLWVHGEHLLFEGRKMSKSAGNVVLVKDIVEKGFDPLSIRLVFFENRYRSQMDLTWDSISAANKTIQRWRKLVATAKDAQQIADEKILQFLSEDLDTPRVISYLRNMEKSSTASPEEVVGTFLFADKVLGLSLDREENVRALPEELSVLLAERETERKNQNWEASDRLRQILETRGIEIHDSSTGQSWNWSRPANNSE